MYNKVQALYLSRRAQGKKSCWLSVSNKTYLSSDFLVLAATCKSNFKSMSDPVYDQRSHSTSEILTDTDRLTKANP